MKLKELYCVFKTSFREWLADNASLRAAALTFFIILPLPTLLLIVVAFFSLFFSQADAVQIVVTEISAVVGPAVAGFFYELLSNAQSPFSSVWTALVVVGFSVGGAVGAFSVLRDTLDVIWDVKIPKKLPLYKRISQKIVPFAIVSFLGLIVIAWTAIEFVFFNAIRATSINGTLTFVALTVLQILFSFAVSAVLFAIIYKTIPDAKVRWNDVSLAAVTTSIAFTITNYLLGLYTQTFTITTIVGAAGSLVIILLWIFVLNEIVLFGAEVSKVYATTLGTHSERHLPNLLKKLLKPIEDRV
jgi:membrane protein